MEISDRTAAFGNVAAIIEATMRRILSIFFLVAAFVPLIDAQSKSGTVLGVVRDPQKVLIPGVQITLTNLETKDTYKGKSNEAGEYKFEVPVGLYSVTAELPGFNTARVTDIRVNQSESKRIDPMTLTVDKNGRPPSIERDVIPIPLGPATTPPITPL